MQMANQYPDMFMATTITENWVGKVDAKHKIDINKYLSLMETYGDIKEFSDTHGNTATIENGILTTVMKCIYGSNNKCHYGKFGSAVIGADAAYNMYHALHGDSFAIEQSNSSGYASVSQINKPGETAEIKMRGLSEDLSFRAACGSVAGTLKITVKSGDQDITSEVLLTSGAHYYNLGIVALRRYENVTITVTYTPVNGEAGSVTYKLVK